MRYAIVLAAALCSTACFKDIVPEPRDEDEPPVSTTGPSLPIESTSEEPATGSGTDDGGDDEDSTGSAADPQCGDGTLDPGEECDDGNLESADGCDETCAIEARACAKGVMTIGENPEKGIGVCRDAQSETCEQDFATLCASGWHLCSGTEHVLLNDGVFIDLGELTAVGVIRCRAPGGAGHYTSHDFSVDGPDSCEIGSSRPDCPTNLGCNEAMHAALCCAAISSCGNGIVDDEREECDDGNDDDFDDCSNACANRRGAGPFC